MKALLFGVFVIMTMTVGLAQAAVRVDFEAPFQPVSVGAGAQGHISGEICPPLAENSSGWADVDMRFSRLSEGAYEGTASQRIDVGAIRTGKAQAWISLPKLEAGKYVRVKFAGRAPASGAVELSIRMQGEPYTSLWNKRVSLSPEWKLVDLLAPALNTKAGAEYSLMFYFDVGVTDLDAISVEQIDTNALISNAPKKVGNLLGSSSFPFGLPSPWSIGAGPIGAAGAADPTVPGPTGVSSLKLTPSYATHNMPLYNDVQLVSPPIAANQCRPHTISFYAKGSVPGQRVSVVYGAADGPTERKELTVNTEWQRLSATFTLPFIVDEFVILKINTDKTLWVDGMQVEEAASAGTFQRAPGGELLIAASRPFGLFVGDEPMRVTYAALGDLPAGATLQGNLVDPYGQKQAIEPTACRSAKGSVVTLDLPVHKATPYGTFRVELRLHAADGKPLTGWSEAVVHHIRQARMLDKDAPDSPFGIHIDPIPAYAEMVKKLGFNWVRIHDASAFLTKWYFLEDKPEHFDFSHADAGIDLFRSSKLMILGMLDTSPTWDSECKTQSWFSKYHIPTAQNMGRWEAYCRLVVNRYKDRIHAWEVWNEPYVHEFFRLRDAQTALGYEYGSPAEYVVLLKKAYAAAKAADPACTVIWSNAAGEWAQGCTDAKAYDSCDEASYHAYVSGSRLSFPRFDQQMKDMRDRLPEGKKGLAFWNTEGGNGATNDTHILMHTAKPGMPEAALENAEYLTRYQLASLVHGAKRFFLYTMHYHGWNASWDVLLPDGSLPPHATAQSALMWHLENKKFSQTLPLTTAYDAHVFAGKEEDVVVVLAHSLEGNPVAIGSLPNGAVLRDLFGNDRAVPRTLDRSVWYITTRAGTGGDVAKALVAK